jgi:enoyl-CoA hydratase
MANIDARVESSAEGEVAWVTIQNQAKANCLSSDLIAELESTFRDLAERPALQLVVLTGAGDRSFIAGANLVELEGFDEHSGRAYITALQCAIQAIRDVPVPVVARVNGACIGAGLEVAIGCDIRIASNNAVFGMPEVAFDLPSVIEAALLPRLIGWGRTAWLLYRGDVIDADTALDWGLVESVVPLENLDAAVAETVATIRANGPTGLRVQKALMRQWERSGLDEGVAAGIDSFAQAYRNGDPNARVSAFRNKK